MSPGKISTESYEIFFDYNQPPSCQVGREYRAAAAVWAGPPQQAAGGRKEKNEKRLEIT